MSTSSSTSSHQESVFIEIQHLNVSNKIRVHNKIAMGGYSDVWHGTIEDEEGTIEVAIKELRVCHRQSSIPHEERLRKRFLREVLVWEKLHHRNIVPLLGWAMRPDHLPRLVSPWYPNGNVIEYLQKHPDTDRPKLLLDVARGLTYLHSLPLVHGDVKGENVLVDAEGCARLGDFGMSTFIDHALHITGFTTTTQGGGTPRCSAPELLYDEQKTKKTDIWAFGCTAIQIITSLVPYPDLYRITAIQASIMCGNPPLPPEYTAPTPQETVLWEDIRRCWLSPDDRPEINWLAERIDELYFHPFNPTTTHAWRSVSNVATDVQGRRSSLVGCSYICKKWF
ncbi:hypothetical protein FRC03_010081 [Tulasnella sp. 419]|nr:hypothetical protein FRC03_010081 [Tulasnella sp. 419]